MRTLAFALIASTCLVIPAFAQTPEQGGAAPEAPGAGAPADQAPSAGKGGKGGVMKEAVQSCRKQAMAKGMSPGKEMRQAVADCVIKDHPGMANVMKCRMDGIDQGMKPGSTDLKTYVKGCIKKSRGA